MPLALLASADEVSTEFKCVLLDLEKRKATSIPDDIRTVATQLMTDQVKS